MTRYIYLFLLGDYSDKEGHVVAKALLYLGRGRGCVLDDIVQECRDDGRRAEPQLVGGDVGDGDGVEYVGLAGLALLPLVGFAGKLKGVAEHRHLFVRHPWGHRLKHFLGTFLDYLVIVRSHSRQD